VEPFRRLWGLNVDVGGDGRECGSVGCGARRSMPTCRQPLVGTPSTPRYGNCQAKSIYDVLQAFTTCVPPGRCLRTFPYLLAPSLSHRRRSAFDPAPTQAMFRMPFPPLSPRKPPEMLESIPKHH
jgi:hypothetical protein